MQATAEKRETNADVDALMTRFKETGDREIRNELVMRYSYIARTVAVEMRSTYHKYATIDEMVNQGVIALIESLDRFDPTLGVKFSTFAFTKVRGAVIDYVRKQDWLPRRVRQNSIRINNAFDELVIKVGRTPTREEMALQMEMSPDEFDKCVYEISGDKMLSYESLLTIMPGADNMWSLNGNDSDPEGHYDEGELKEVLASEINKLNDQERLVLSLYYHEELTMKEICKIMGVTEQRVGQINRKLVTKLRAALVTYMKG